MQRGACPDKLDPALGQFVVGSLVCIVPPGLLEIVLLLGFSLQGLPGLVTALAERLSKLPDIGPWQRGRAGRIGRTASGCFCLSVDVDRISAGRRDRGCRDRGLDRFEQLPRLGGNGLGVLLPCAAADQVANRWVLSQRRPSPMVVIAVESSVRPVAAVSAATVAMRALGRSTVRMHVGHVWEIGRAHV